MAAIGLLLDLCMASLDCPVRISASVKSEYLTPWEFLPSQGFLPAHSFRTRQGGWSILLREPHGDASTAIAMYRKDKEAGDISYIFLNKPETKPDIGQMVHNARGISNGLLEARINVVSATRWVDNHPPLTPGTGIGGFTIPMLSSAGGGLSVFAAQRLLNITGSGGLFLSAALGWVAGPVIFCSALGSLYLAEHCRTLHGMSNPENYLWS